MICVNWSLYQQNQNGSFSGTGRWYEPPCASSDSVVMSYGEFVSVVPQSTGITTAEILYVVTWGFGVVLLGWLLGYGLGLALGLIKKV